MKRIFYVSLLDGRAYTIKPLSDISVLITNDKATQSKMLWSHFIGLLYGGLDKAIAKGSERL